MSESTVAIIDRLRQAGFSESAISECLEGAACPSVPLRAPVSLPSLKRASLSRQKKESHPFDGGLGGQRGHHAQADPPCPCAPHQKSTLGLGKTQNPPLIKRRGGGAHKGKAQCVVQCDTQDHKSAFAQKWGMSVDAWWNEYAAELRTVSPIRAQTKCVECKRFVADDVTPSLGLGYCTVREPGSRERGQWANATHFCDDYSPRRDKSLEIREKAPKRDAKAMLASDPTLSIGWCPLCLTEQISHDNTGFCSEHYITRGQAVPLEGVRCE